MRHWPAFADQVSRRAAVEGLLTQCAAIYRNSFNAPPWNEQWSVNQARDLMRRYHNDKTVDFLVQRSFWALLHTEGIHGLAIGMPLSSYEGHEDLEARGVAPDAYWISDLATDPTHRRRGCCTKLLTKLLKGAQKRGFQLIVTRTRTDNKQVLGIFTRLGFARSFEYMASTGGVESPRVVLSLHLPANPPRHFFRP